MEIYVFGSIARGEIDKFSDIDLLILKDQNENLENINKADFSIYTYDRIKELWKEGNPFAWHLFVESKCIFSTNKKPFIEELLKPNEYNNYKNDLLKFYKLFTDSVNSIKNDNYSVDFDLSMIFLSIRNFASCFALGVLRKNIFSRDSALKLDKYSICIDNKIYTRLKEARLFATRGVGSPITFNEYNQIINEFPNIDIWFNALKKIDKNE